MARRFLKPASRPFAQFVKAGPAGPQAFTK